MSVAPTLALLALAAYTNEPYAHYPELACYGRNELKSSTASPSLFTFVFLINCECNCVRMNIPSPRALHVFSRKGSQGRGDGNKGLWNGKLHTRTGFSVLSVLYMCTFLEHVLGKH